MSNTDVQDLSDWITKQEAARELGLSEKSIDRMAEKGQLQKAKRKQRGSPAVAVFHPADIERLKAERAELPAAAFLMPLDSDHNHQAVSAAVSISKQQPEAGALLQALTAVAERMVDLKEPFFLTLKQARDVSGLPISFLRSHFVAGGQAIKTGGGWRVSRVELDRFARESMRTYSDTSGTDTGETYSDTSATRAVAHG